MRDIRGREVRYQVISNCAECADCHFDTIDECFRCVRHAMQPKVDPMGELPDWCFLLRDSDILSRYMSDDEARQRIDEADARFEPDRIRYAELEKKDRYHEF